MTVLVAITMFFGALAGLGLYLLFRGLAPTPPPLGPVFERLETSQATARRPSDESRVARWLALHLAHRLRPPLRELQLTGISIERYVLEKIGFPLVGLLFPPSFATMLALCGIRMPITVPVLGSVLLALMFFVLVDVSVRQKADEAREEFTRSVAIYLDLVALQRSASHGPVESLERAAQVGNGWVFARIRDALDAARVAGQPPWNRLSEVARDIGVPELGDVGDIMRLSGEEGAQVYQTLVSRSQSLRVALRSKETDRANTATTLLYIPTSLTVFVLFVLAGYPFLIRLVNP